MLIWRYVRPIDTSQRENEERISSTVFRKNQERLVKSNKQVVKNKDLWERLDKLAMIHTVDWHWVKGHSGHRDNELADQLANAAIDKMMNER